MNESTDIIQVELNRDLIKKLLDGLFAGAQNKALKVLIGADGRYHIKSKGLVVILSPGSTGTGVERISLYNSELSAEIGRERLEKLGMAAYANQVYEVLRSKYSPYFHSLAEHIILFNRAYWDASLDG